jgi:hypothetical protein
MLEGAVGQLRFIGSSRSCTTPERLTGDTLSASAEEGPDIAYDQPTE